MATSVFFRSTATKSITAASVVPLRSERSLARWIVGPSATGSLNGTPNSSTSAPASAAAKAISTAAVSDGSPAVIYATKPISLVRASSSNRLPIRVCNASFAFVASLDIARQNFHILVPAPGNIQNDQLVAPHFWRAPHQLRQCVRRFERGNDALEFRQQHHCLNCFFIAHGGVLRATAFGEPRVFRTYSWIVESC